MQKPFRVNNQIRILEVTVIDDQGKQLGKMRTFDALQMAKERGLDLVEVGPNVQPPIAKIMDYGKYIYQKERQEKKAKNKQKDQELKTVRVGFKTGNHDLNFKASHVNELLEEGHMVKIELTLRGREKALSHIGREKLDKFLKTITEPHIMGDPPKRSPFGWIVVIRKDAKLKNQN